jgi:hypothetical protein
MGGRGVSAELVDPFAPATSMHPMTVEEYDAIRDDIRKSYMDGPWMLPALLSVAVAALGVIAETGTEADNRLAAQTLRHLVKDAMEAAS